MLEDRKRDTDMAEKGVKKKVGLKMAGKWKGKLRQVPWQSWEHWNEVALALFSDSPTSISAALDRVVAWQSRGHVPVAVEITAELIGIHQRDPLVTVAVSSRQALTDEMLRMMYSMAIMRLVNGVVDQSQKRNSTSVADRAEAAGLPRLMVDIRHGEYRWLCCMLGEHPDDVSYLSSIVGEHPECDTGRTVLSVATSVFLSILDIVQANKILPRRNVLSEAAHNELPGVSLLRGASKQALAWLKKHYWELQQQTLLDARATLRLKLVQHALLSIEISRLSEKLASNLDEEQVSELFKSKLRGKRQERRKHFEELLDLTIPSVSDVVSILIDDGLLEQGNIPSVDKSEQVCPTDLESVPKTASCSSAAWKFLIRRLVTRLPQLPSALLVAIVRRLTGTNLFEQGYMSGKERGIARNTDCLKKSDRDIIQPCAKERLMELCAWLLAEGATSPSSHVLKEITSEVKCSSKTLGLKATFSFDLLQEVLKICLKSQMQRASFNEIVSNMAARFGSNRFYQQVMALAQLGIALHSRKTGPDESMKYSGQNRSAVLEDLSSTNTAASSPMLTVEHAHDIQSLPTTSLDDDLIAWMDKSEVAITNAKMQQQDLFAKILSRKNSRSITEKSGVQPDPGSGSTISADIFGIGSSHNAGKIQPNCPKVTKWCKVDTWLPCAMGTLPSVYQSNGVLSSLDTADNVFRSESSVPVTDDFQDAFSNSKLQMPVEGGVEGLDDVVSTDQHVINLKRNAPDELNLTCDAKRGRRQGHHVRFKDDESLVCIHSDLASVSRSLKKSERSEAGNGAFASLMQGCVLQHGSLVRLEPKQVESIQSAIHVL